MRLFEHPDFEQAILRVADDSKLSPAIVEKDYYITEALRVIATTCGDKIIFKGGTSLTKGWNLIERFSEDIDIFLDPKAFQPALGKNGINRELKKLCRAVEEHPAFSLDGSKTIGGFGRNDSFSYKQLFGGQGQVVNRVLIEAGTASGRDPSILVELHSHISLFLKQRRQSLGADDEKPFSLQLLHFRRTFVEKMFAIHSKVEMLKRKGRPLGSHARHYYDLFQLSSLTEIETMLRSAEYAEIKTDYDLISREHFPENYFFPEGMSFGRSDALFPPTELARTIGAEYESQCRMLCYRPYPSWAEVQARFMEMRNLL